MLRQRVSLTLLTAVLALGGAAAARAADPTRPGTLDRTFGTDGVLRSSFGLDQFWATGLVLRPDGDALMPGLGGVAAATAAGRPDLRFGPHGLARTPPDPIDGNGFLGPAVIAPGGGLTLTGRVGMHVFTVVRLRADGQVDTAFAGGQWMREAGGEIDGTAITGTPDGRVWIAALVRPYVPGNSFGPPLIVVWAFDAAGVPVARFGNGGKAILPLRAQFRESVSGGLAALLRLRDGRLRVVLSTGGSVVPGTSLVAGMTELGITDSSVGVFGLRTGPARAGDVGAAALDRGDRLVVGFASGFGVMRTLADGVPDATFGHGGVVAGRVGDPGAAALALSRDGLIAVAGATRLDRTHIGSAVLLLDGGGRRVRSFGAAGVARIAPPRGVDEQRPQGVAFDPRGGILVAGDAGDGIIGNSADAVRDALVLERLRTRAADVAVPAFARVTARGRLALPLGCRLRRGLTCSGKVRISGHGLRARARLAIPGGRTRILHLALGRRAAGLARRRLRVRLEVDVTTRGHRDVIAPTVPLRRAA